MTLRLLAVAALVVAASCGAPAATSVPPSTAAPTQVDSVLLAAVRTVWGSTPYSADVLSWRVQWRIGSPPAGYWGWTAWRVTAGVGLTFVVTLHPDFVAIPAALPRAVAHEGGHIICVLRWNDGSEACANRIAASL